MKKRKIFFSFFYFLFNLIKYLLNILINFFILIDFYAIYIIIKLNGDWGLGIGDWGLGIGPNPQSQIPNPQSPIPIL